MADAPISKDFARNPSGETLIAVTGPAYREDVVITELHSLMRLQARSSATLADSQVVLLRDLAARLATCGAADAALRVDATADQLEAAARETWLALRSSSH
jgi:hypothetical protein